MTLDAPGSDVGKSDAGESDVRKSVVRKSGSEPKLRGMDLVRPSLRDATYLDCRRRAEMIAEQAAKLPWVKNLLDVGGRGKPYACFFTGRVANHYVLDVEPAYSVDVVGDARNMPLSDASMDVVMITQVLEHIPDPIAVIGEIRRVLKPGGTLLLSVPSIFPQHGSPGDYWRYMPQGLQWILRDFHNVTVKGEAGTVPSIFLVINVYVDLLTSPWPWLRRLVEWTICPVNNLAGLLAAKVYRGDQFASNYFVVAVR
ncbi:MAG: class I SAM-dependent methyltransferase [Terriglobales bacterium]|jgi:SAM-dependent methyltransferase